MLAGALLAAGAAGAQERPRPAAAIKDAARDVRGVLDLRRVALVLGEDGRLRSEITMRRSWDTADLRGGRDGPGSICLRLWTERDAESEPPDWLICATAPAEGEQLVGRVLRERTKSLPRPAGDALVSRPTARTVYLRFSRSAIRRPALVRFSAEAITRGSRCGPALGCRDLGPEPPDTAALTLRPE